MNADDAFDPLQQSLGELTALTPDARRAARVRDRCRARLRPAPAPTHVVGPVLFTGLCVLYLSALVLDVLLLRATP